jgi:hypothetical protein
MMVRPTPKMNGPNAASAAVHPMNPAGLAPLEDHRHLLERGGVADPENRKIASIPQRNRVNPDCRASADEVSGTRAVIVKAMEATSPIPETSVQIAPPIRSVRGENRTRAPATSRLEQVRPWAREGSPAPVDTLGGVTRHRPEPGPVAISPNWGERSGMSQV